MKTKVMLIEIYDILTSKHSTRKMQYEKNAKIKEWLKKHQSEITKLKEPNETH